jgi:MFS family permease
VRANRVSERRERDRERAMTVRQRGILLGALCLAFVLRQFYGTLIAVVAPDISRELAITPEQIGKLAGIHLAVFAAMQLPVGMLLDRFGSRVIMPVLLSCAALGAAVFGLASSMEGLALGYALVGLGLSGTLMGSLVVISRNFPLRHLASYSSMLLGAGGIGTLLSSAPFTAAAQAFGWRNTLFGVAALTVGISIFVFLAIPRRDPNPDRDHAPQTLAQIAVGFREVWRNPNLPPILAMSLFSFSVLSVMRAVWAGPYLHDVYGVHDASLGNALLVMSFGIIIGTLAYGPLDRLFKSRKKVVTAGALLSATTLGAMALLDHPGIAVVTLLLGLLGAVGPYDVVLLTHARAIFPAHLAGRGLTTVNVTAVLGAAVLQTVTGLLIAHFPGMTGMSLADSYRVMFAFLSLAVLIGVYAYSHSQDVAPQTSLETQKGR